jgi:hypothetical protein
MAALQGARLAAGASEKQHKAPVATTSKKLDDQAATAALYITHPDRAPPPSSREKMKKEESDFYANGGSFSSYIYSKLLGRVLRAKDTI